MKKKHNFFRFLIVGALALAIAEGCSKDSFQDGAISTQGTGDTTNVIGILSNRYSKPDHWVGRNFQVTWVNRDNNTHTVTGDNNAWSSGPIQPGGSYTRSFSEIGSYGYFDEYSTARGTINVFGRDE